MINPHLALPQVPAAKPVRPRRVVMLAYPGADLLDITGPLDVFAGAAALLPPTANGLPAYQVEIVAPLSGALATSSGIKLVAERHYLDVACREVDTIDGRRRAGLRRLSAGSAIA